MEFNAISTTRALAEGIANLIYWASPYGTREDGNGGWRAFTDEENRRAGFRLGEQLNQWRQEDPEGFAAFEAANRAGEVDALPAHYCTR